MQVLTHAEIGRFLARAKEEGYYELFLLELSTGMRRGEIVGLKWSDFNAANNSLRIARQANRVKGKTVIQPPKTKTSIRTVVLPQYMTEILAEMKRQRPEANFELVDPYTFFALAKYAVEHGLTY